MSSPSTTSLCLLPFILAVLFISGAGAGAGAETETPTVYQVLEEYDFPIGLLPKGVKSYTLNKDTGAFSVNLGGTCKFSIVGYDLKYKSKISGVISNDKLTKLKGVSVKVTFVWFNIVEVTRDRNELYLSVGLVSAGFDVSSFEESPECGCGFDCNDGLRHRKMMVSPSPSVLAKLLDW